MKRLYKIFMAVAAVAAVGCTTDATDDLGVNLNEGQTTLTLSLDDTRTQLGVKGEGETEYPLYWANGDAISVNGSVSNALEGVEQKATTATFTFDKGFGDTSNGYFVAYPATSTNNQVVFAAEQTHASNTSFGNNAAAMYGYATDLKDIKLSHLTGVLKIGIVSGTNDPAYIKEVRISTVDRKPIAGAFNVDADGKLTATTTATEVITYKAASEAGFLVLPAAENNPVTYVHIAVPAGEYGELYVTVEDTNGDVMYKTVTTDSTKPLNAGKVREFTNNLTFVPTAKTEVHLISSYSDLYEYKEAVEGGSTLNAVLVNDVEIPDAGDVNYPAWESIKASTYTGTFNGNGFAIKGLYAPLFNETAASFKGLHLVVDVEEKTNPNFGAFARKLIANGNAPKVEHCSVSGTITINTAIDITENSYYTTSVGAFAGAASGVVFEDCVNNATIEIKSLASSESTKTSQAVVGGIIGYANTANSLFTEFTNCHNAGAIEFNDASAKLALHLGGIVAVYHGAAATATFDKCSNSGNMTVLATTKVSSCNLGGIIGYTNGSLSSPKNITFANDIANSGNILLQGTYTSTVRAGGILGYMKECVSLTLNGEVTNSGYIKYDATGVQLWIGGIMGSLYSQNTLTINNKLTNTETADITINGKATGACYFGGIYGYNNYDENGADDADDTEDDFTSNKISITGRTTVNHAEITVNAALSSTCYVGGIFGFSHNTPHNMSNNARVHNTGILRVSNSAVVSSHLYMGGAAGYMNGNSISGTAGQVVNEGEIRFEGEAKGSCYIGGIYGQLWAGTVSNSINVGDIYAIGKVNASKTLRIGGHLGNCNYTKKRTYSNCQIYCDITAYCVADDKTVTSPYTIGLLTGSLSERIGTGCNNNKIGGRIATSNDGNWLPIDATNYADYVIGVRNSGIAFTGVSLLTSEDQIVWGDYGN